MPLADAVKGARKRAQTITWTDEDGGAINLTGTTLTDKLKNKATGAITAMDGTLTLVTPASGIFTWAYGVDDVGTPGDFEAQFTATYSDTLKERTFATPWKVHPGFE